MTKRIILAALIFVLSFSLFSCQREDNIDKSVDADIKYTEQEFINNNNCDVFVGKIINKEIIDENVEFSSVVLHAEYDQDVILYTVEVDKTYLPFVVTEGTTIQIISVCIDESYLYSNELKIGEKYLLSGIVQSYKGEPVIVIMGNMTANITDNGKLIPETSPAEEMYAGIDTIEELEADPGFTELCNSVDAGYLSPEFYSEEDEEATVNSSEQAKPTKEQVIENIREALKVDSELEMNIDYNNFPDTDTE